MLIHMDLDGTTECDSENVDKYAMLFNRSPLMHSSVEAKEVSYASLNGFRPDVCQKNVETQTPSQIEHNNTDDEDQCFEDTFDWSMELSFCEAVKIDANLQYEKENTYKCSISNTCSMLWARGAPQLFATTAVRLAELVLSVRYELIASRSLTQFLCKIYAFWPFWSSPSCTRYVSYVGIKENLLGLVLRFRKIRIEKYVFYF
jgi:hypothetical protein